MPDAIDKSVEEQEEALKRHIEAAKKRGDLTGSRACLKCGDHNDRWYKGYGVCSDCFEEAKDITLSNK